MTNGGETDEERGRDGRKVVAVFVVLLVVVIVLMAVSRLAGLGQMADHEPSSSGTSVGGIASA